MSAKQVIAARRRWLQAQRKTTPRLLPEAWVTGLAPASAASWSAVGKRSRMSPSSARIPLHRCARRGEGHDDLSVRQVGDGLLDAAGQPGDLADQALEHGGKGADHLALGLGFGLVGQAGRCGTQPRQQLGGAAATAVRPAREKPLHPLLAEAGGRLRVG